MKHTLKNLIGFTITATDGEIGKVDEFYFDDSTWTIRYLVVKTGGWLLGRKVLLSPGVVTETDWDNKTYKVNISKKQVEGSPDIDADKPVSRQHEIELYEHYGWPFNSVTGATFYGGIGMTGMTETRMPFEESIAEQNRDEQHGDPHLRSSDEVRGYQIHASDGEFGKVEDFIPDDQWKIRYLIVDTGNWFSDKKVIVSPQWITDVRWEDSQVYVDLSKDAVENSPEYKLAEPVHEMYERSLFHYYGKEQL